MTYEEIAQALGGQIPGIGKVVSYPLAGGPMERWQIVPSDGTESRRVTAGEIAAIRAHLTANEGAAEVAAAAREASTADRVALADPVLLRRLVRVVLQLCTAAGHDTPAVTRLRNSARALKDEI